MVSTKMVLDRFHYGKSVACTKMVLDKFDCGKSV
jgi:hypothetical protein